METLAEAVMGGTLIGSYRLVRQIGAGGMGAVFLAEHVTLGRRAAIKVLHGEYSSRPEIVSRFFNEARAATAIHDPGIVQIFDFGKHTDGSAYIVMELLDGEPLDRRLERGPLAVTSALRIMRQVAGSLAAAHAAGIVHRDLKPENIFLVRDAEVVGGERAKILDFGIAKLANNTGGVKTQTSAIMGTPMYMSPEQCRGAGEVDHRSDIYAFGCVLFALLTGRPPFEGEGFGDIIVKHLMEPPRRPSMARAGVPVGVDELVLRCLEKNAELRFSTATELAFALATLLGSIPDAVLMPPSSAVLPTASTPTTLSAAASESSRAGATKSRAPLVAAMLVLVASLIALGVATSHRTREAAAPVASDATRVVTSQPAIVPDAVIVDAAVTVDAGVADAMMKTVEPAPIPRRKSPAATIARPKPSVPSTAVKPAPPSLQVDENGIPLNR